MKGLINIFDQFARRNNASTVLSSLLDICLTQFANPDCEISKQEYAQAVLILNDKKLINEFFREFLNETKKGINSSVGFSDVFGHLYMEVRGKYKGSALGQFFTPTTICQLMAKITPIGKENALVSDPTSGSGRLLLASYVESMPTSLSAYYVAEDLDIICVKMTALNMIIHGLQGEVLHHDSLLSPNSWWRRYSIVRLPIGLLYYEIDLNGSREAYVQEKIELNSEQLKLF